MKKLEKLLTYLSGMLLVLVIISIAAVFTGTLVWILWPVTIPFIFGTILPIEISWWTSVKFCWLCALLFKSTVSLK